MKSFFIASVLILLTATLNASNISASTVSTSTYEFQSFIGVPCGSGLPSDLCTSSGDAIVLTKSLLAQYSAQGWQLLSTTPLFYGSNNEGVAFLMGYNPRSTVPVKPQQFEIVMATSCGQDPSGLPSRLCTPNGTRLEEVLNGFSGQGWQVVNTTSCAYWYEQGEVGMTVYLLSK